MMVMAMMVMVIRQGTGGTSDDEHDGHGNHDNDISSLISIWMLVLSLVKEETIYYLADQRDNYQKIKSKKMQMYRAKLNNRR